MKAHLRKSTTDDGVKWVGEVLVIVSYNLGQLVVSHVGKLSHGDQLIYLEEYNLYQTREQWEAEGYVVTIPSFDAIAKEG